VNHSEIVLLIIVAGFALMVIYAAYLVLLTRLPPEKEESIEELEAIPRAIVTARRGVRIVIVAVLAYLLSLLPFFVMGRLRIQLLPGCAVLAAGAIGCAPIFQAVRRWTVAIDAVILSLLMLLFAPLLFAWRCGSMAASPVLRWIRR
jgi:hypothetical protein